MEKNIAVKYNAYETNKGNIIWCGTLALAWKELAQSKGLSQLRIKSKKANAQKIAQSLNNSPFQKQSISDKSIYIKCGNGPQTLKTINKEIKSKFPKCSFPDLSMKMAEADILSCAYLFKQLQFDTKFTLRTNKNFRFNGHLVKSFYAEEEVQKKQIRVHSYQNRNNFLISIGNKSTDDVLYLLKNQQDLTVDEAIDRVIEGEKKGGRVMKKNDLFQMPVLQFDCSRSVKQLVGAGFHDDPLKQYYISMIMEAIKLKVDESGAKVQSRAVIKCTKSKLPKLQPPQQFILDTTFWLVMKQIKKHPYIFIQVKNPVEIQSSEK